MLAANVAAVAGRRMPMTIPAASGSKFRRKRSAPPMNQDATTKKEK